MPRVKRSRSHDWHKLLWIDPLCPGALVVNRWSKEDSDEQAGGFPAHLAEGCRNGIGRFDRVTSRWVGAGVSPGRPRAERRAGRVASLAASRRRGHSLARSTRTESHPRECRQPAVWEELDSFRTPTDNFFFVNHYGQPTDLDEATWHVGIGGLVHRPLSLSLADIKARARHEVDFTLECSGNTGSELLHRRHRQRPLGRRAAGPAAARRREFWRRPGKSSSGGRIAGR